MNKIVTRESLQSMLDNTNTAYVDKVIGRALVALFKRQTEDERAVNATENLNSIGFAGCDGRQGSLTAKFFIKHNTLLSWQREIWLKKNTKGYSRLTKYWKQLNEIANENAVA